MFLISAFRHCSIVKCIVNCKMHQSRAYRIIDSCLAYVSRSLQHRHFLAVLCPT